MKKTIPKILFLNNYKSILNKIFELKSQTSQDYDNKIKFLLDIYDRGEKFFNGLQKYECEDDSNNFYFTNFLSSLINDQKIASTNSENTILEILYRNRFYIEFKIFFEEISEKQKISEENFKNYSDILDLFEYHREGIELLNKLHFDFNDDKYFFFALARAYYKNKEFLKSYNYVKKALKKNLNDKYLHLAAQSCKKLGQFLESSKYYEIIVNTNKNDFVAKTNLGANYELLYEFKKAEKQYREVINSSNEPYRKNAIWNLGLLLIKIGKIKLGHKFYETRYVLDYWSRFYKPKILLRLPRFKKVDNCKILVTHEQGFGDTIQYFRYIEFLSKRVKSAEFLVQPKLKTLFNLTFIKNIKLIDEVKDESKFDYWIPLMSVPFIFNQFKYPQLDKKFFNIPQIPKIKNNKLSIGVCWRGSKTNTSDEFRSINLEDFINFFKLDFNFYILQIDLTDKEKDFLSSYGSKIITPIDNQQDFSTTADVVSRLDLVATVDTAIMHLASSIGIKTYGLIGKKSDHRWGIKTTKTDLYENLELIRQEKHYEWERVIMQTLEKILLQLNL